MSDDTVKWILGDVRHFLGAWLLIRAIGEAFGKIISAAFPRSHKPEVHIHSTTLSGINDPNTFAAALQTHLANTKN